MENPLGPNTERNLEPADEHSNVGNAQDNGEEQGSEPRKRRRRRQINGYSIGETISVNCSTISALMLTAEQPRRVWRELPEETDDEVFARSSLSTGGGDEEQEEPDMKSGLAPARWDEPQSSGGGYCGDPEARRRALISGKHYTLAAGEEVAASSQPALHSARRPIGGGQQQPSGAANKQPLVAYLSLGLDQRWPLNGRTGQAGPSPSAQGVAGAQVACSAISADSADDNLGVPALLEWFINNQEVSLCLCCCACVCAGRVRVTDISAT